MTDAVCTPQVIYSDPLGTDGAKRFAVLFPDVSAVMQPMARQLCTQLFAKVEDVSSITQLTIEITDGEDGTSTFNPTDAGGSISLASGEIIATGKNRTDEQHTDVLLGRLAFWASIGYLKKYWPEEGYLLPGHVIEGLASVVRHRLGYTPVLVPARADYWWDDTAPFLLWVDDANPGFIPQLVVSAAPDWQPEVFRTVTGKTVEHLWSDYQLTIP